jgi:hypothetical protein
MEIELITFWIRKDFEWRKSEKKYIIRKINI